MSLPQYEVVDRPCNLVLDLDTIKKHLELNLSDSGDNHYLSELSKSATFYLENHLNLFLLNTTLRMHLDDFSSECIEIRRRPNVAIVDIQYFKDNVLTTVAATDYYLTFADSRHYPTVQPVEDKDWPSDADCRKQAVQINFTVGFGASKDDIPQDLRLALLNHIAAAYSDRGDCGECAAGGFIPEATRTTYNQYKVIELC